MTISLSPVRLTGHSLSLDLPSALQKSGVVAARSDGARKSAVAYGIEILRPEGWVPLTSLFGRRVKTFSSASEAMTACIAYWRRTGYAARPFIIKLH